MSMTVRVRFAPSPTGHPHIGNIRTVVFNWLFARQQHGQFVLRIEDTDRTRYVEDALQVITSGLRWLGMDWDEGPEVGGDYGPYVQSERTAIYQEKAEELVAMGKAYRCDCTPERLEQVREAQRARGETPMYDGRCRNRPVGEVSPDQPHVIRLKVPREGVTVMHDILRGDIVFENRLLDDQVLLKSDRFPTYHLAVVVDDHMMGITHVMRGDDWISSEPKRLLMYEAFGWEPPVYAHVPLVLGTDGKKLGKRHGAVSIDEFRRQGYLPEAVFNFLALLGWAPGLGEEQEIFTREELIERFDITRINLAPAVFSYDKLNWMNGAYIRALPPEELLERLIPFWADAGLIETPAPAEILPTLRVLVPLVQERLKTLRDVVELTDFVFTDIAVPPVEKVIGSKMTAEQSLDAIRRVQALLAGIAHFEATAMEIPMRRLADDLGLKAGQLFGIVRNAVTGKEVSPPLFGSIEALGRAKTLKRLEIAEEVLVQHIQTQEAH
ncbi:MAG TPA: glutamate--tRNA ligase [Anaerolineae bacterium]|nr:glutamate--tRNA ligase [Anaerolineae bacterium]HQI82989.1 glutamate--tRNA ligase [Anaerolineae bacterium]